MTMMNLVFQAELMATEKKATTVAMALYSGLFNVGIGTGPVIGALAINGHGLQSAGYFGALIALAGSAVATLYLLHRRTLRTEINAG